MNFKKLIRRINWYPPYLGAGIKVIEIADDMTRFKVRMKLRWYNRNLVGTQFGGSLYAMCDPFFMFILMANLGKEYIVWDKNASINFVKPGRGTVYAVFEISAAKITEIKEEIETLGKKTYTFYTEVLDEEGNTIARLEKGVYVRKKKDAIQPLAN